MISYLLFYHDGIKLDINCKRNYRTHTNLWKLNSTLSKDEWIADEIKNKINSNENENQVK